MRDFLHFEAFPRMIGGLGWSRPRFGGDNVFYFYIGPKRSYTRVFNTCRARPPFSLHGFFQYLGFLVHGCWLPGPTSPRPFPPLPPQPRGAGGGGGEGRGEVGPGSQQPRIEIEEFMY